MKTRKTLFIGAAIIGLTLASCNKVKNGEVITDTYTGNVAIVDTPIFRTGFS